MAKRGRPKLYDVKNRKLCDRCKYHYSQADCCGYYLETGELRTVSQGKKRLPKGKCDKFTEGKVDTAARREAFCNGRF